MIKSISKKKTMILFIIAILIISCFIWYKELKTNRDLPKKAKFVDNVLLESEKYG